MANPATNRDSLLEDTRIGELLHSASEPTSIVDALGPPILLVLGGTIPPICPTPPFLLAKSVASR